MKRALFWLVAAFAVFMIYVAEHPGYHGPFAEVLPKTPEGWTAFLTGILALVTALLWRSTDNLVLGAEATSQRQLRAYVLPVTLIPSSNVPVWPDAMNCTLNIQNTGQTPADKVRVGVLTAILPIDTVGIPDIIPPNAASSVAVLGPGVYTSVPVAGHQLRGVDGASLKAGTHELFVWGRIDYRDVFGNGRWSTFKFMRARGRQDLFACSDGNEAN